MKRWIPILLLAALCAPAIGADEPELRLFFEAASDDEKLAREALKQIAADWKDSYTIMFVDIARLMRPSSRSRGGSGSLEEGSRGVGGGGGGGDGDDPFARGGGGGSSYLGDAGSPIRRRLVRFLKKQTGKKFGDDLDRWRQWVWSEPYEPHADYALFKAAVYRNIDQRMIRFFPPDANATIRLDEIDWGGVAVNGVPPLDHPPTAEATSATWMGAEDIVFGVLIDGVAKAYPKKIVAWHEMVRDQVGQTPIALVYCTLCGSVIPYDTRVDGQSYTFGTSGLLYRSNKLMFDEETLTLWSSIYGRPVVGSLVAEGRQLKRLPVVTTSWKEWTAMHPETSVLTPETGHRRDYSEGAAYADYNATDRLWFEVPQTDDRLPNKTEVVTLVHADQPLALTRDFLKASPLYTHTLGGERVLFVTDGSGGSRAYRIGDQQFVERVDARTLVDSTGNRWTLSEDSLSYEAQTLDRLATSPAFWFGWFAQHPETELVAQ